MGSVPGRFSGTREVAVKRHSPSPLFRPLASPPPLLSLFSNGEETGHRFPRYKPTNTYITSGFFQRWTKGNGWRKRERKVSSSAFRANIGAGHPKLPSFRLRPRFVSQGKRKEREKGSRLLPRTISSSAVPSIVSFPSLSVEARHFLVRRSS